MLGLLAVHHLLLVGRYLVSPICCSSRTNIKLTCADGSCFCCSGSPDMVTVLRERFHEGNNDETQGVCCCLL